jgi:HlyD family secretion protein
MTSSWLKRGLMALAAVAMIGAFAYALSEKPTPVDVARVLSGPMKVTILQEATTRVRDIYAVSSPIAGHLARSPLEEGDAVTAGQTVIATIHPLDPPLLDNRTESELKASREAARAALAIAETDYMRALSSHELARQNLARATQLSASKVISESILQKTANDEAVQRAQVEAARAAILQRRAELQSAEARLSQPAGNGLTPDAGCCVSVTAPASGVVLSLFAKSEQPVAVGTKIAEIGNPADLEIVADLISEDAVRVRPGDKAEILDWGGDRPLKATLRRVDPAAFTKVSALGIEEQRVNAVFDLDETDPRLGHGFRVYAEITIWSIDKALTVPISALFRNGNDWNAFVLRDGRLHQTVVSIDHMNDTVAQATAGLAENDIVVVHPGDTLADGLLAEPRGGDTK